MEMSIGSFPSRPSSNDDPQTNGELHLWRWLIEQGRVKSHVVCAGAAWDWGIIKHLPDNGTTLHLFEPLAKEIDALKLYASATVSKTIQANIRYNICVLGAETCLHAFWQIGGTLYQAPGHPSCQVSMKMLDEYCSENGIVHIDFLKIDTEGWELDVLKGARNILDNCDFIQFEYGGTFQRKGILLKDVYEFLKGWSIFSIEPGRLNLRPEAVENYAYANFLATKKL